MLLIFISGAVLFFFTLMRLKRVEADEAYIYVTNYKDNFKYTYTSILKFKESDFLFLKIVTMELVEAGSFGKKVFFIANRKNFREFMEGYEDGAGE